MRDETQEIGALWYCLEKIEDALQGVVEKFNEDFTNQYYLNEPSFQLVPTDSMHPTGIEISFSSGDKQPRLSPEAAEKINSKIAGGLREKLKLSAMYTIHVVFLQEQDC